MKFAQRHIGISPNELKELLAEIKVNSLNDLISETIPSKLIRSESLKIGEAMSEQEYLGHIKEISKKNKPFKSYIGMGYYDTITPSVILRNVFENPGWYTQYTPYQAEISQGRLESLLNYQTMICDLTGMPIANASLLDEATAAAEAMYMFFNAKNKSEVVSNKFLVDNSVFPQIKAVLKTKAEYLHIEIVEKCINQTELDETYFGVLIQNPSITGSIVDFTKKIAALKAQGIYTAIVADIMSLVLVASPGEMGADCAVGSAQRFGVPIGFGGPYAAFFATTEEFKRSIPGRIIGVSKDRRGKNALRMALQTREQHIRREKATSNICTAQALLANMAAMYAVYHGPENLKAIATDIHSKTVWIKNALTDLGIDTSDLGQFFDTIAFKLSDLAKLRTIAEEQKVNFYYCEKSSTVGITLNENTSMSDCETIIGIFKTFTGKNTSASFQTIELGENVKRKTKILTHPIFNTHHTETKMMRYIKYLEDKDLSLTKSMIPLGSCTMKLNAATELMPLSWENFSSIHPFAPQDQAAGYYEMLHTLEKDLAHITGFAATSLQPNSGAQGEYAGLMVIRDYQKSLGQGHRNICIIPSSAHGTNPASAVLAGLQVVVSPADENGNINLADLKAKAEEHKDNLCALMVTYPSTHGIFEESIMEVCQIIHDNGGQVYMDGANMNAQVGITSPGFIGADVCHLNLHKTFAIPHGGGGPGVGPICVASHLAPFLPTHPVVKTGGDKASQTISAAPFGSASICLISYAYIKMLGSEGLRQATEYAILNANYIKTKLEQHYEILYTGDHGRVAHELIVDFRPFKHTLSVEVEDVAKRLMDYGIHAPTVSFPVAGTLMIEPTESEDKKELDRLIDALIAIRGEIADIEKGLYPKDNNPLKNAPHTAEEALCDEWKYPYSRELALYPLPSVKQNKFWVSVSKVDSSYGDRNLVCSCLPIENYM
jgi:glycine dehydrogenase